MYPIIVMALSIPMLAVFLVPVGWLSFWISEKLEGQNPGALRQMLASMAAVFVGVSLGIMLDGLVIFSWAILIPEN